MKKIIRILGPGLLYAGAAIGVSHLVQSTRAGANFGFELAGIIIVSNLLKYPFFRFAPHYTAVTGKNLIAGYRELGQWAVWLFFAVSLVSMFVLQAGVTLVTAGLLGQLTGGADVRWLSFGLLLLVMIILIGGKYGFLDSLMKYVMLLLTVSLFGAVVLAFGHFEADKAHWFFHDFSIKNPKHLAFLIAFVGWMPAPLDVSVWQSLWAEEKNRGLKRKINLKEGLLDFHVGYVVTVITALAFLSLGALVMHGSGKTFTSGSIGFAGQLINLFTVNIGNWAFGLIALAAFTTMFSTTITCFDAYARVMTETERLLRKIKRKNWVWMLILFAGSMVILFFFSRNMKQMVDFATTLSFILAPVIAVLNYLVITGKEIPAGLKPGIWLRLYAVSGILLLTGFSLFYLYWRFIL